MPSSVKINIEELLKYMKQDIKAKGNTNKISFFKDLMIDYYICCMVSLSFLEAISR